MFGQLRPEFSALKYFGHLFLGCWAPMIGMLVSLAVLEPLIGRHPVLAQIASYVLTCLCALLLGYVAARFSINGAGEGRTAGLFPATIWLFVFLLTLAFAPTHTSGFFYYPTGPGNGEAALGVLFFTLPTWSCCWYSLGMRIYVPWTSPYHDHSRTEPRP